MCLLVELVGTTKSWNIALYQELIYALYRGSIDSVVPAALGIEFEVPGVRFAIRYNEVRYVLRSDNLSNIYTRYIHVIHCNR